MGRGYITNDIKAMVQFEATSPTPIQRNVVENLAIAIKQSQELINMCDVNLN